MLHHLEILMLLIQSAIDIFGNLNVAYTEENITTGQLTASSVKIDYKGKIVNHTTNKFNTSLQPIIILKVLRQPLLMLITLVMFMSLDRHQSTVMSLYLILVKLMLLQTKKPLTILQTFRE